MSRTVNLSLDIFDHWFFENEPFGYPDACIWLNNVYDNHSPLTVLSKFKWDCKKLSKFLVAASEEGLIDLHKFEKLLSYSRKNSKRQAIPTHIKKLAYERDGEKCRYCGDTSGPFHLDHIKPWSKGGLHTVNNLTVACAKCNMSKKDKSVSEWKGGL